MRLFVFEAGEAESDQQTAQQPSTESPYKHGLLSLAPAVLSSADIAVQSSGHTAELKSQTVCMYLYVLV